MSAIPLHSVTPADAIRQSLEETLALQRAAYFAHPYPSFAERKADLLKLKALIRDNREAIVEAINKDYGNRSRHETLFAEICHLPLIDIQKKILDFKTKLAGLKQEKKFLVATHSHCHGIMGLLAATP